MKLGKPVKLNNLMLYVHYDSQSKKNGLMQFARGKPQIKVGVTAHSKHVPCNEEELGRIGEPGGTLGMEKHSFLDVIRSHALNGHAGWWRVDECGHALKKCAS